MYVHLPKRNRKFIFLEAGLDLSDFARFARAREGIPDLMTE